MKRFLAAFAVFTLLAGSGCSPDRIAGPLLGDRKGPGELELRVSIPVPGAAALLVVIGGGPVDSLTSDLETMVVASGTGEHRAILRGTMRDMATVRLWVPDVAMQSSYYGLVEQVVDGTTYERRDAEAYSVRITFPRTRSTRPRGG